MGTEVPDPSASSGDGGTCPLRFKWGRRYLSPPSPSHFYAAFTLRPIGLRVHVASSRQMRYMPRASSRMCALDGIITRKKHPACDMRRQDASKLIYIEFSRISKLNLCLTARITAARMLGMAKLSLEVPSQVHQLAFSLCQMLQILCCGST